IIAWRVGFVALFSLIRRFWLFLRLFWILFTGFLIPWREWIINPRQVGFLIVLPFIRCSRLLFPGPSRLLLGFLIPWREWIIPIGWLWLFTTIGIIWSWVRIRLVSRLLRILRIRRQVDGPWVIDFRRQLRIGVHLIGPDSKEAQRRESKNRCGYNSQRFLLKPHL